MKRRLRWAMPLAVLSCWPSTPCWAAAIEHTLSFDSALDRIIARSTAILIEQAGLGAATARAQPANLFFLPSVSALVKRTQAKSGDSSSVQNQSTEGVADWNLFRFGADWAGSRAATLDERAAGARLENQVLSSETDGVGALVNLIRRSQESSILGRIVKTQAELLEIAQERFKRGLLSLQEVNKLEVDLENAQARLKDAEVTQADGRAAVGNLMGADSAEAAQLSLDWPWRDSLKREGSARAREGLKEGATPAWLAARLTSEAEDARVRQAFRKMLPSLDAQFTYGYYRGDGFTTGAGWNTALTLSIPLFSRLTDYAAYRVQAYTEVAADARLDQAGRDARSEWEAARADLETTLGSATVRDHTLTVSRKLYDDNLRHFQAGRISVNDLTVDETRMYDSELLSISGWSATHIAYTRLCHALGRRVTACGGSEPGR